MMSSRVGEAAWPAFDLLKCLCVMGMVLVHGIYETWTVHGRFLLPPESSWRGAFQAGMFLGVFPLTLPLLAGVSLRLRLVTEGQASTGGLQSYAAKRLLPSALLAAVGYTMNVLVGGWNVLWAWNVLQLIAISFLLIGLLYAQRSIWPVAAFGLCVVALSDPLRMWWPPESRGALGRVVLGDPTDWHAWPVFPWSATVAFGVVLAEAYLRRRGRVAFVAWCAAAGVGLAALGAAGAHLLPRFDPKNLVGSQVMQPPAEAVLGMLGAVLLLVAALTACQERLRFARYGTVRCFSAGILWIYVTHIVVGTYLSNLIFSRVSRAQVVAHPAAGWHPVILIGLPAALFLVSWLVGYLTVRWLHEKRLTVRLRKGPVRRAYEF
jgi:Heparan-alpha-glucosaminide N-acetyltransferase, catalytic